MAFFQTLEYSNQTWLGVELLGGKHIYLAYLTVSGGETVWKNPVAVWLDGMKLTDYIACKNRIGKRARVGNSHLSSTYGYLKGKECNIKIKGKR